MHCRLCKRWRPDMTQACAAMHWFVQKIFVCGVLVVHTGASENKALHDLPEEAATFSPRCKA